MTPVEPNTTASQMIPILVLQLSSSSNRTKASDSSLLHWFTTPVLTLCWNDAVVAVTIESMPSWNIPGTSTLATKGATTALPVGVPAPSGTEHPPELIIESIIAKLFPGAVIGLPIV